MNSYQLLDKLNTFQESVWKSASTAISEAASLDITIANPLSIESKITDLYSELSAPMVVIQFEFSSRPDSTQVILLPKDAALSLGEAICGSKVEEVDEAVIAELRGPLEAMVQGICGVVGSNNKEMIVPTGLTVRFQVVSIPYSLRNADRIIRTQAGISGGSLRGSLTWLMDTDAAMVVLGISDENDAVEPFPTVQVKNSSSHSGLALYSNGDEQDLELIHEVPLEMSVEIGRTTITVRELLELTSGSIVEIDKATGEPVEVLANGRVLVRGEVVVIDDNFGVRITEVIDPKLKSAREQRS